MKNCLLPIFFAFLLSLPAFGADESAPRPDVEELLTVSRVQKLSEDAMARVDKMMQSAMAPVALTSGSDAAQAAEKKLIEIVNSGMSWDKMRGEYARIYAEVYTPEETGSLIAFYKSPTGKMFLDKEPLLMQKTLEFTQKLVAGMMPKMQYALSQTGTENAASPSPAPAAADAGIRPDIEELMTACRVEKLNEDVLVNLKTYMDQAARSAGGQTQVPDKLYKLEQSELSWDRMKGQYGRIYGEVFTPDEARELTAFYKTPAGQAFVDSQPRLMRKTMELTQKVMSGMMPKVMEAMQSITSNGGNPASAPGLPTTSLSGTYVLMARPANTRAIDKMEFNPDGSCTLDIDERTGIPGTYHLSQKNDSTSVVIDSGTASEQFAYRLTRQEHVLNLTRPSDQTLFVYGLVPKNRQHVEFSDVEGIYLQHDSNSDNVTDITPDHRFQLSYRAPDPRAHTYTEGTNEGACTFDDGIITYFPEQPYDGQSYQYLRDVVVKHDGKGLWVIDPYEDAVVCETPEKNLELPPPPEGYKAAP